MALQYVTVIVVAVLGYFVGAVISPVAWRVPRDMALHPAIWSDMSLPGRATSTSIEVRPPVLEVVTAALFVAAVLEFGLSWVLPAFLWLAAAAVLLAVVDLRHQRLPNAVVGPFAAGAVVLLAVGALGEGSGYSLIRAAIGGAGLFLLYLALALISPSSLGMGDVKLAAVLGIYLAYIGWRTLFVGAIGAFLIAAVVGVILLITRRAGRRTQVPFGPSMLAAALAAIAID